MSWWGGLLPPIDPTAKFVWSRWRREAIGAVDEIANDLRCTPGWFGGQHYPGAGTSMTRNRDPSGQGHDCTVPQLEEVCANSAPERRALFGASRQMSRCSEDFTNASPMKHKLEVIGPAVEMHAIL